MSALNPCDTALDMLDLIPPFMQGAKDAVGVFDAVGRETERLEAAIDTVRQNFYPLTANQFMRLHEATLGLPIDSPYKGLNQRRVSAAAFYQGISDSGSGPSWQATLSRLIGSGWSYDEHTPPALRPANMMPNPRAATTALGSSMQRVAETAFGYSYSFEYNIAGTTSTAPAATVGTPGAIPVTPGERVNFRGKFVYLIDSASARQNVELQATFYNSSNVVLLNTGLNSGLPEGAQSNFTTLPVLGTVYSLSGWANAPADTASVTIRVRHAKAATASDVQIHWSDFMVSRGTSIPAYHDGDQSGWEWLGTAHNSVSRAVEVVPPNVIRITLPFSTSIGVPTISSVARTGTGGFLPGASYYYSITAVNFYGETTRSPLYGIASSGTTAQMAVSWAAVTGAASYRVYRGLSNNGSDQALAGETSALTYTDLGDTPLTVPPPLLNSTASFQSREIEALARQITPAHLEIVYAYGTGFIVGVSRVGEVI